MSRLIKYFQRTVNSVTVFLYLLNLIFLSLLYNNPFVAISIFISLLIMAVFTNQEKFLKYIKFSVVIFLVTLVFNLILNQRGTREIIAIPFVRITQESILNGAILGLSFVNLLWSFYLYDALIKVKTLFELLSKTFKSVALIFILTIKFIPRIIKIYNETKSLQQFRNVSSTQQNLLGRLRYLMDLTEIVLNKSIADFMGVSDTLLLKGYGQKHSRLGKIEFQRLDKVVIGILILTGIFNGVMAIKKYGTINFGSAKLLISWNNYILGIIILTSLSILLPLLIGGISYLWWKFYVSKTTTSSTITARNYR